MLVKNRSAFLKIFIAIIFILIPISKAEAGTQDVSKAQLPLEGTTGIEYFVSVVNGYTGSSLNREGGKNFVLFSTDKLSDTTILYMNSDGYKKQPSEVKQKILTVIFDTLNKSNINTPDQNRIRHWVESIDQVNAVVVKSFSTDTQTDLVSAQKWLQPFTSPASTLLGVLTIIIAVLLTLSYVWDLAFINIPFISAALWKGGQMTHDNKPLFVSQDVVRSMNTTPPDGSILATWFGYRIKTTILLGICLTYLVSNQIWSIISWIIDILSRILGI